MTSEATVQSGLLWLQMPENSIPNNLSDEDCYKLVELKSPGP